ncbi:MAG TPA: SH3 domain-containing protein, partial [Feifaniaceae bacterium]|nr:SH3 domain-containing protein [Feifaniaceae bacterium]
MKAMHTRRLAAAALATILLFALAAPALAASTTVAATANVNIRTGPGTSYQSLGMLYKGNTIIKTGTSGDWTKVLYNNKTAYIKSSYLKAYSGSASPTPIVPVLPTPTPAPAPTSSLLYALAETAIRKGPGSSYKAIGYLDPGDSISPLGAAANGYYQVQLGGNTGYVRVSDVTSQSPGSSGTVYAVARTPVYGSASVDFAPIGYLSQGQSVARTGTVGSYWTRIVYNGKTCYVLSAQVASLQDTASSEAVYAVSTTAVYSSASSSSAILGYLTEGSSATRTGATGSWTQVLFSGQTGYVRTSAVTSPADEDIPSGFTSIGRTMYALSSRVYCYSAPSERTAYSVGYLSLNETVWAIASNGTWTQAYVQGERDPLYILANKLGYSGAGTGTGAGVLYVQYYTGAPTYSDMTGTAFLYTYRPAGSSIMETVASIDRGVAVSVQSYIEDWVYVSWAGRDNVTRFAYVKANKLGATSPQ